MNTVATISAPVTPEKDRTLMLFSEIDRDIAKTIIEQIERINRVDDERESKEKDFQREPIKLIINSFGGAIIHGFSIISAIEASKTPIHTICLGTAMSMGLAIFVSGHKRFAHRLTTFMYHEASNATWGKLAEMKDDLAFSQSLMDLYDSVMLKRTNITKEKLDDVKNKRIEWYIFAEDAVKYGIVDELIV